MKRVLLLMICLSPALAFGEELYTNADLAKFEVPGAYTNEDLRQLPPLAIQTAPANVLPPFTPPRVDHAAYQAAFNNLRMQRDVIQTQIDIELGLVEFSESSRAGYTQDFTPRLGYRATAGVWVLELMKRLALADAGIERFLDDVRRAGAVIDKR